MHIFISSFSETATKSVSIVVADRFLRSTILYTRFCVSLFSALQQTRCAVVACDSQRVTVAFSSAFRIILAAEVVYVQRCSVVT